MQDPSAVDSQVAWLYAVSRALAAVLWYLTAVGIIYTDAGRQAAEASVWRDRYERVSARPSIVDDDGENEEKGQRLVDAMREDRQVGRRRQLHFNFLTSVACSRAWSMSPALIRALDAPNTAS